MPRVPQRRRAHPRRAHAAMTEVSRLASLWDVGTEAHGTEEEAKSRRAGGMFLVLVEADHVAPTTG
jgi:hypothetical protein